MMKQLLTEWRNFIDESLAKDVQRYNLVVDLYDHIIEEVSSATKESGKGLEYSYGSNGTQIDPYTEISDEDGQLYWYGIKLKVALHRLPEHLKKIFKTVIPKEDGEEVSIDSGYFTINFLAWEKDFGGEYDPVVAIDSGGKLDAKIWIYNCNDIKNIKNLKKDLLATLKKERRIIIHEVSHMIDDLSLIGYKKFRKAFGEKKSEEEIEKYHKKGYYNAGIELNAKWSEVLDMMKGLTYSDYNDPEADYRATFEQWVEYLKPLMIFDKMSLPKQRKFITRFYEYYKNGPYQAPDRIIKFEVDRLVDLYLKFIQEAVINHSRLPYEQFEKTISLDSGYGPIEIRDNHVWMVYYNPNSPRPYSRQNSDIILSRAKPIIEKMIERFLKTEKKKREK